MRLANHEDSAGAINAHLSGGDPADRTMASTRQGCSPNPEIVIMQLIAYQYFRVFHGNGPGVEDSLRIAAQGEKFWRCRHGIDVCRRFLR
jgi:hypothetical protein